jgi:mono/diheme cytochrome c family protein
MFSSHDAATLRGSDLYRLNCQGCHGESGEGAPPEINSIISPVRATSVDAVIERMKSSGAEISRQEATKMAQQARNSLMQRLHEGGENMPAFQHLSEAEIHSLLAYLEQLSGIPDAENELTVVKESPYRIGEHIVKFTCHTCHSAVGANPTPQELMGGAIPPLSTLLTRVSEAELIRKVTHGAPIIMGTPPMVYRGRMPVFDYLTPQEADDVYWYLTMYPPSESENHNPGVKLSLQTDTVTVTSSAQVSNSRTPVTANAGTESMQENTESTVRTAFLLGALALFVFLLLAGGLGFSIYEFRRLSPESKRRNIGRVSVSILSFPAPQRDLDSTAASASKARLRHVAR